MTDGQSISDLVAEIATLRRRVDELEAIEQIRRLRNRFHDFVNTDRWDEIGSLFAEGAVLDYDYVAQVSGRKAIGEFFTKLPAGISAEGETPFVRQFIHGHSVKVTGDTATGVSHLFATPVYNNTSLVVSGRFEDTYGRVEGEWLFTFVRLRLWYSVPLAEGWASSNRHQMSVD
jgi:hypothetical protein